MQIQIDPQADALYLTLKRGRVHRSREVENGVVLDLDAKGTVLGIEMLDISKRFHAQSMRNLSVRRLTSRRRVAA